ncbi:MAG: hypothetical protein QOD93_1956 [Acetobacteraceae bacterium]|jgi:hypothetical protein|nr:hypothetical protein [Acetobacteraceae bacterium]MEA2768994.1 hypothetical protein [Acetobacteraceae bacterium]
MIRVGDQVAEVLIWRRDRAIEREGDGNGLGSFVRQTREVHHRPVALDDIQRVGTRAEARQHAALRLSHDRRGLREARVIEVLSDRLQARRSVVHGHSVRLFNN